VTVTIVRYRTAAAGLGHFCTPRSPVKPKKKMAAG
jgi:hypothetical protein